MLWDLNQGRAIRWSMVVIRRGGTVAESSGKEVVAQTYSVVTVLEFGWREFSQRETYWQIWVRPQLQDCIGS